MLIDHVSDVRGGAFKADILVLQFPGTDETMLASPAEFLEMLRLKLEPWLRYGQIGRLLEILSTQASSVRVVC